MPTLPTCPICKACKKRDGKVFKDLDRHVSTCRAKEARREALANQADPAGLTQRALQKATALIHPDRVFRGPAEEFEALVAAAKAKGCPSGMYRCVLNTSPQLNFIRSGVRQPARRAVELSSGAGGEGEGGGVEAAPGGGRRGHADRGGRLPRTCEKGAGRSLSPSFFPDRGEMPKNPKFLLFY